MSTSQSPDRANRVDPDAPTIPGVHSIPLPPGRPEPEQAAGSAPALPPSSLHSSAPPTPDAPSSAAADAKPPHIPQGPPTIPGFRILYLVGEGGMGSVYLAEQQTPRRTVALKVVRPGSISRSMLRRFELETHVLGRLQHPGIAQIFEAGTFDAGQGAQPYFAMEYVKGRPLSELILERSPHTRDLLELMARICDAVQHAHTKGVIHRDLKPGNILIVEDGIALTGGGSREPDRHSDTYRRTLINSQPKVLDFGVARATDMDIQLTTVQTNVGQLVGTLPYMSPEQIAGVSDDLDTRSDVYSLGVILYELLAGRLPHDVSQKTVAQAARIISEHEPAPLSSISRVLKGDIETIVGKALEKDKTRRYQSASDLAADIRRFLEDQPIVARPPSAMYQIRKFAKRNKSLVSAVFLVALVIIAALIVVSFKWMEAATQKANAVRSERIALNARDEAMAERDKAEVALEHIELERNKASAINKFLIKEMLGAANPDVAQGEIITVKMVLDEASTRIDTAFPDQPELEGTVRGTIGEAYIGLGQFREAQDQFMAAAALLEKAKGPDNQDALQAQVNIVTTEIHLGEPAAAEKRLTALLPRLRQVFGEEHRTTLIAHAMLAASCSDQGRYEDAAKLFDKVIPAEERVLGPDDEDTQVARNNYAYLLCELGRYAEAEAYFRALYDSRRRVKGETHPSTIVTMANLAVTLSDLGRYAEAEQLYRQAMESCSRVLGPDHPGTADAMANLGVFISKVGKLDEAMDLLSRAHELRVSKLGPDHPDSLTSAGELVSLHRARGELDQGAALGNENLANIKRVLGPDHQLTLNALNTLATIYYDQGDYDAADDIFKEVWESRRRTLGDNHPQTIASKHNYAALLTKQKKLEEAQPLLLEVLEASKTAFGPQHPQTMNTVSILGTLREDQGRLDEAAALFREAWEGRKATLGADHPDVLTSQRNLGGVLIKQNKFAEAEPLCLDNYQRCLAVFGAEDPKTTAALERLIEVCEASGAPEKAQEYRKLLSAPEAPAPPKHTRRGVVIDPVTNAPVDCRLPCCAYLPLKY